jgi:dTDP-4-amino-4,6-dideoxygalactose transaminase
MIPFNKPCLSGKESEYILKAVQQGKISGNGYFTEKCQQNFQERFAFKKCLLTTSCTDALEMSALLVNVQPGDEVIMPSYTFVSTANAFVLRGATIRFVDSQDKHPNMDANLIEELVTPRTKAIVVVHYAGMACEMDTILAIAQKNNLIVVEDAAQAIDSRYKGRPLGGIGHLAAFSFHETKNIISGEGGMLVVNDQRFEKRADIIWEKGTNRKAFFQGQVNKYDWVDVGSSFLPSEIIAAFLFAQLEKLEEIQSKRKAIWEYYFQELEHLQHDGSLRLPAIPSYSTNNAHLFYLVCPTGGHREALISHLQKQDIFAVFHYQSLHSSPFYKDKHGDRALPHSDHYSECLVRLPFYNDLTRSDQDRVIEEVYSFFKSVRRRN